jgi:hypothetical protein
MDQDEQNQIARERCEMERETQRDECAQWNEEQVDES